MKIDRGILEVAFIIDWIKNKNVNFAAIQDVLDAANNDIV